MYRFINKRCLILIMLAVFVMGMASCEAVKLLPEESNAVEYIPIITEKPKKTIEPLPNPTATPMPTPEPTPEKDEVAELIGNLSDRELIGQLVMCGFTGEYEVPDEFKSLMEEYKLGNVILFGQNINTDEQTKTLTDKLIKLNAVKDIPLFISTDVEGGQVRRYDSWSPNILSAQKLYEKNDTDFTYEQFKRIGTRLLDDGINMDLSPVLDVSKHQETTFLGDRIFGADTDRVSKIAEAEIEGLHDAEVISIGKHFPGHGGTDTDSHEETPVIDKTMEEIENYDLIPFKNAIESGIDGIMVGHLLYPQIDDVPASVSEVFIGKILRDEMGFDGIVMSDDMRMGGIRKFCKSGEAAVRFIKAGGDLVLIGTHIDMQKDVLDSLYNALQNGDITRERLEESAYRIVTKKLNYR